ncbi:ribonuclease H [Senna tora]|uniref:Ribonuclease H n=1 Tax=Senna tora TaxID=362788 RepID=A0A834WYS0_9FABA|nr:ribonuclease H [Senna tora]
MGDVGGVARPNFQQLSHEPPDPGEGEDSMEESEGEDMDDDCMEGSEAEEDCQGTVVPCTLQREEDLRQINEVVELMELGNRAQEEGRGFAGGIWVGWTDDVGEVEVMGSNMQYIHLKLKGNLPPWVLTVVYASPHSENRQRLWYELKSFSASLQEEWALIGDFNDILCASEKKGGAPFNPRKAQLFAERIDDCNLMELPTNGSRICFPEASIKNLTKMYSDHRSLLVNLYGTISRGRNRPFRFEAAWMLHRDFVDFVKESWTGDEH